MVYVREHGRVPQLLKLHGLSRQNQLPQGSASALSKLLLQSGWHGGAQTIVSSEAGRGEEGTGVELGSGRERGGFGGPLN